MGVRTYYVLSIAQEPKAGVHSAHTSFCALAFVNVEAEGGEANLLRTTHWLISSPLFRNARGTERAGAETVVLYVMPVSSEKKTIRQFRGVYNVPLLVLTEEWTSVLSRE